MTDRRNMTVEDLIRSQLQSLLSPLLFLIYVNDMSNPSHHQTNKLQFADDAGQWAVSKNIDLAAEYLQRDLDKLARWCDTNGE